MERKEKAWRIVSIVFGALLACLLIVILVLQFTKREGLFLTYPLIGVLALFLISDELSRHYKHKIAEEEAKREAAKPQPEQPEHTLPEEAFSFEEKQP